jgi:hypothetical protein
MRKRIRMMRPGPGFRLALLVPLIASGAFLACEGDSSSPPGTVTSNYRACSEFKGVCSKVTASDFAASFPGYSATATPMDVEIDGTECVYQTESELRFANIILLHQCYPGSAGEAHEAFQKTRQAQFSGGMPGYKQEVLVGVCDEAYFWHLPGADTRFAEGGVQCRANNRFLSVRGDFGTLDSSHAIQDMDPDTAKARMTDFLNRALEILDRP